MTAPGVLGLRKWNCFSAELVCARNHCEGIKDEIAAGIRGAGKNSSSDQTRRRGWRKRFAGSSVFGAPDPAEAFRELAARLQ